MNGLERLVSFGGEIRTVGSLHAELGDREAGLWLAGYDRRAGNHLAAKMLTEAHYLSLCQQAREDASG